MLQQRVDWVGAALASPPRDVLLVAPPAFIPRAPHLGVAVLEAYLRGRGVDVRSLDLNLASYQYFLSPSTLLDAADALERHPRLGRAGEVARLLVPAVLPRAGDALKVIRDPDRTCDLDALRMAHAVLDRCLQVVAATTEGVSLSMLGCSFELPSHHLAHVLPLLEDPRHNPYVRLFSSWLAETPKRGPRIVGLSVCYFSQLIPALTLARAIRTRWPDSFMVLGGNMIDILGGRMRSLLRAVPEIDGAVRFGGEDPVEKLLSVVDLSNDLSMVPALMWRRGDELVENPVGRPPRLEDVPTPHFAAAPMAEYLTADMVLPVALGRGCYYGQCPYCDSVNENGGSYRSRRPEVLAREMVGLARKHGVRLFSIVDEAVPLPRLAQLAERLLEGSADVEYRVHARIERTLPSPEVWQSIRASGCRRIQVGLESGSDRVLTSMRKGVTTATAAEFLKATAAAGIQNHVFLMAGFPGESNANHQETLDFLELHRDVIHSASVSAFVLPWRRRNDPTWIELGVRKRPDPTDDLDWCALWDGTGEAQGATRLREIQEWIRRRLSPIARKGHDIGLSYAARYGGPSILQARFPPDREPCTREPGERCIIALSPGVVFAECAMPPTAASWQEHAAAQFLGYFPLGRSESGPARALSVYHSERDILHQVPRSYLPLLSALGRPIPMGRLLDLATAAAPALGVERSRLRALWTRALHELSSLDIVRVVGCNKGSTFLSAEFLTALSPVANP